MADDNRTTISFTAESRTAADIETYEARTGKDNRSQAVEELVEIGLREQRGPLLYRWRESAADVALIFACGALATTIIGMGTPLMSLSAALGVAAAFAAVGMGLVAAVEVGRTFNGQNELARVFRRVRQ